MAHARVKAHAWPPDAARPQQLNDADLLDTFAAQDGGEIGRAVWMRTHSDETLRLFDVAESILNTGDIRGNKRLYDAFDVPCEDAPPFIWNDAVKKELETRLTYLISEVEAFERRVSRYSTSARAYQ